MPDFTQHKPATCQSCTLYTAPGPCWGSGDPTHAKIIYIAQNPGQDEVRAEPMQPLIGPSGRIFNRQLFEAGIRRDELFITNQVKCLTPANRAPTDNEIRHCKPLLQRELDRCRADTVVLAGDIALKANLDRYSSISPKYRPVGGIFSRMGCVERRDGRKWISTIHPAFVMRMPEFKAAAVDHLKKAWVISGLPLQEIRIVEYPTNSEVLALVDHIMLSSREFADDVETAQSFELEEDDYIGGDYHVTMCGVGGRPYEALVLTPDQIPLLAPIYSDPGIEWYEHNGNYDQFHIGKALEKDFNNPFTPKPNHFDTMQATHFLRSFAPKKLKPFVLSQYTCLPYYQGAGSKKDHLGSLNMRLYNGMDIITTFLAAKEQKRQLANWNLTEVFREFGMPVLPILEEMRINGVNVNLRRALVFKRVLEQRIAKAQENIGKIAGPMFNPNSSQQVRDLLYNRMKLPVQYNQKGRDERKPTADFEARKRLRRWVEEGRLETHKVPYILLQLLDFIAGEEKKLEYIGRISGDGRMHPYYKAHGTSSFRLSSSPNLQNFPVYDINDWGGARRDDFETAENPIDDKPSQGLGSLRSLIVPDDPETDWLLTCDFEQLQMWIYAARFQVKWLLEMFENREYIYGIVYEALYKEPFFQPGMPKQKRYKLADVPEQRIRRAKAVPLGLLKGRTAGAIAKEYGWPLSEANNLFNWFFSKAPEMKAAHNAIEYQVKQKGYLKHAFGQLVHFPAGKLSDAFDSCAQSDESFVLRGSLIEIQKNLWASGLRQLGNRLALTTHDSITINVKHTNAVQVYETIIKPALERPIPQLNGFKFRHSADMTKQWDWNTTDWPKWKAEHFPDGESRTAGSVHNQEFRGQNL